MNNNEWQLENCLYSTPTPPCSTFLLYSSLTLASPGEVTSVKLHGTVLEVSTSASHSVDSGSTELGVGRGTTRLILSLLLKVGLATTSGSALVSAITRNTHLYLIPTNSE
jgi:hypothetical protein